uniref:Astacin domain-containing protein n=1 Tax=Strongyloides papillosus TaxID=174720 RepID=A0A0N5BJW7_STREA
MNLSFLIVLLSVLCILPNLGESKKKKPSQYEHKIPPYPTKPSRVMYYVGNELGPEITRKIDTLLTTLTIETCLYFERQNSKKYPLVIAKNNRDFLFFIGLALGLVPEITRNDSRQYVEVFSNHISKSKLKYYQEKKYESKVLGNTSFDFYSKMIPSSTFGSKNKKKTYRLKADLSEYYEKSIDLPDTFSFNDIKRLWYYYCNKCEDKPNNCQHGGYCKDSSCDKCKCPLPFIGDKCEKMLFYKECHNMQHFTAYPHINYNTILGNHRDCYYSVKSKNGKKVQFEIFNLTLSRKNDCYGGVGLEVKYREDKGAEGLLLCDNYTNIRFPPSSEIYLNFAGDGIDKIRFSYIEAK